MSKESAIRFLRKLRTDEKAKELLQGRERPKNREDAIKAYSEVASELGEDISAEDFAQALEEIEAEIHQKTEAVSADMKELEDEDLEGVAGGFYRVIGMYSDGTSGKEYNKCVKDFVNTECWDQDACEKVNIFYYDCSGKFLADGAEYDCYWYDFWCRPE